MPLVSECNNDTESASCIFCLFLRFSVCSPASSQPDVLHIHSTVDCIYMLLYMNYKLNYSTSGSEQPESVPPKTNYLVQLYYTII